MRFIALGQALIEHDLRANPYPGFRPLVERLKRANVCFSNFEGAIKPRANAMPTRDGIFFHGATQDALDCLKEFSINLLSLSNNHSFDWGVEGIRATINAARARGFVTAGTGAILADAAAPAILETPNGRVALVAFASKVTDASLATETQPGVNHLCLNDARQPDPNDAQRILDSIRRPAQHAELIIAYHHDHYWESDQQATPAWKQIWARECIDAGAHAYISHGIPMLHGIEIYKQRPIFYGLGNFIFHTKTPVGKYEPRVWESVIADCTFERGKIVRAQLVALALNESGEPGEKFFETRGRPSIAERAQARSIIERLQKLSEPFGTQIEFRSDCAEIVF